LGGGGGRVLKNYLKIKLALKQKELNVISFNFKICEQRTNLTTNIDAIKSWYRIGSAVLTGITAKSTMSCVVTRCTSEKTDVSEVNIASIFRVIKLAKQETKLRTA
jgi:hypothetical protein